MIKWFKSYIGVTIFAHVIDGKALAKHKETHLSEQIAYIQSQYAVQPALATILVGEDPASRVYVGKKLVCCQRIGIKDVSIKLPESTTESELIAKILALNTDTSISGILVQMPLPKHIDAQNVIAAIDPLKDVDGFHPYNLGRLFQGRPQLRPCTPYGVMQMLQSLDLELKGLEATVVGVSHTVGRPMFAELLLAGCTVTACHRLTKDLPGKVARADLVVSATGVAGLIKGEWIKPGAIVIDVGIIRLPNGKLVGDVEFEEAQQRAGYITPVPGGVGPMTVITLMQNTIEAFLLQRKSQD